MVVPEPFAAPKLVAAAAAQTIRNFSIGTGDPTGTYYPIGGLVAEIVSAPPGGNPCRPDQACGVPGLVAVAQTSGGSVANLQGVARGRFDSAFAQADVAHGAWRGEEPFAAVDFARLRALAGLYPEVAQLVLHVDAPWPPRRLAVGSPESGTALAADVVLEAFGIGAGTVAFAGLSPAEVIDLGVDAEVDGFLTIAGTPTRSVREALDGGRFKLVSTPLPAAREMVAQRPHWRLAIVSYATYGTQESLRSVAVPALWLARDDLDDDLARDLLTALWAPPVRERLDSGHPAGRSISLATALTGISVPLHAGADRFYREAGLLVGPGLLPGPSE